MNVIVLTSWPPGGQKNWSMANHLAVPPLPLGGSSFLTPGMASGLTQMWTENHFRHIKPPHTFLPKYLLPSVSAAYIAALGHHSAKGNGWHQLFWWNMQESWHFDAMKSKTKIIATELWFPLITYNAWSVYNPIFFYWYPPWLSQAYSI